MNCIDTYILHAKCGIFYFRIKAVDVSFWHFPTWWQPPPLSPCWFRGKCHRMILTRFYGQGGISSQLEVPFWTLYACSLKLNVDEVRVQQMTLQLKEWNTRCVWCVVFGIYVWRRRWSLSPSFAVFSQWTLVLFWFLFTRLVDTGLPKILHTHPDWLVRT